MPEPLGSKPKFWFREGERRLLFKADDRGTGEDWAEVIASHLCDLLGIPHVEYELAQEFDKDIPVRPGVICENMVSSGIYLAWAMKCFCRLTLNTQCNSALKFANTPSMLWPAW